MELGKYCFEVQNERMTLSLLSLDGRDTDESDHLLLVALGWCGNLDMKFEKSGKSTRILRDAGHGPVSIDTLEGTLSVIMAREEIKPDTGEDKKSSEGNGRNQQKSINVDGACTGKRVYPLNPDGIRMKPLEGKEVLHFTGEETMYFEFEA